jgi:release factor glutamine methyltransferase
VNEDVLIPRPETEELVELIIADRGSRLTDISILDIGTGSGCIPIALKKNLPAAMISAIDISEQALTVAKNNAEDHNTSINFMQMDFLDEEQWKMLPHFDIIVSNPPYIPENEKDQLAKNVLDHEPHRALFVADNRPLLFYEKIAVFGKTHLKPNGKMYMETHSGQAGAVAALFQNIYSSVEIKNDLFGKERMVIVSY